MSSTARIRRWWAEEEDQILRREADFQLSQGNLNDWNRIAAKLPGRTNKDCRKRWSKVCGHIKKGAWSNAEDQRLRTAVEKSGYRWTNVAQSVETRHADQCAKRWLHSLDPSLDHSEWLPEDDDRLLEAVGVYGRVWKSIGEKEFPGRSATDIKNRYVIVDRKRRQALGPSSPPTPGSSKNDAMTVSEVAEVDMDDSDLTGSVSDQGLEDLQDMDLSFGFDSQSPSTNTTASYYTPPGKDLSVSFPILPEEIQGFSGTPNTWLHQTEPSIPWDNSMPNLDNPWNVEHLFPTDRNAVDNTIPLEPNKSASSHRSTLILEDVQPDTVNCIMNTLFKSNTKVKMRLFSQE